MCIVNIIYWIEFSLSCRLKCFLKHKRFKETHAKYRSRWKFVENQKCQPWNQIRSIPDDDDDDDDGGDQVLSLLLHGGYFFMAARASVCKLSRKVTNGFWWYFQEECLRANNKWINFWIGRRSFVDPGSFFSVLYRQQIGHKVTFCIDGSPDLGGCMHSTECCLMLIPF